MDSFLTITAALLLVGSLSSTASRQFDTECYTANGEDYRGCQNQTSLLGGKPCLFWNETFQHPYNTLKYPNGEGGLGSHNYCRNPDGDVQTWCYIADHEDGIYWRYCDIPTCQSKRMCVCVLACASESCSQRPVFLCYTLTDLKAQRPCSSLGRGLCQSHGVSDSYENVYRSSAEAFH
ncbi:kremen protein 1-like [Salmo trutta]|uniref:kremen protein 1-like n=1 Tax=Salmo trutta TaxID=8032 RepID=UPI00113087DE|nr:kremen protein 1-like [Salmo trutta]